MSEKSALMSRRGFIAGNVITLLVFPIRTSTAQQRKTPLLGWLSSAPGFDPMFDAFRAGLRNLDYVEGRSIRIAARSVQDNAELRAFAQDLVRQQVDVIVTSGRAATRAAQETTATIPIVMAPIDDPYEFVASLSRPSGNITGLALQQPEIDAKQIEILKEMVPGLSRLAIFFYYGETYYALESTARALGIEVFWMEAKRNEDVERAFAEVLSRKVNGLLIVDAGAIGETCNLIAAMAQARRIPAAASWRSDADVPLLLTYAADEAQLQSRAASYVDRLLKGTKPQDLPVEQATQFQLIVNLKVATEIGVTVPSSILLRAHQVID